ncbi:MAG: hypothetical protein Q4F75_03120 [Pseudomonadota bacterium]|nr:hypothetical protein [Pseudomonadota bacterium]
MKEEKKTESTKLWQKIWGKVKTYAPAAVLLSNSLNITAAENTTGSDVNEKSAETETLAKNETVNDHKTLKLAMFQKAYPGKFYNEICNGSPCWLASTYETRGAGQGKKINSAGTWNDKGNYRGINQMSPGHALKYLKWMEGKEEFKNVYAMLKIGGIGKANWQNTAKKFEHEMILSQEGYMTEVYSPENFKAVQDLINKSDVNVNIKKLHPAILSCMHQLMVELPSWRTKIANKIISYVKEHDGDEKSLNSKDFVTVLVKGRHTDLAEKASSILEDKSIRWKDAQFAALVSQAKPKHDENVTWFTMAQAETRKKIEEAKREVRFKKLELQKQTLASNVAKPDKITVNRLKPVTIENQQGKNRLAQAVRLKKTQGR